MRLRQCIDHGYIRYVVCLIPEGKELERIDCKLIKAYGVTHHRATRARRRALGVGNVVYVRFGYMFVLLADELPHPAFDKIEWLNFRNEPLKIGQYSVGIKGDKAEVRIASMRLNVLKKEGQSLALKKLAIVEGFLRRISPFSYQGINRQRWKIYKQINQRRKLAGLELVRWDRVSNLRKNFPR